MRSAILPLAVLALCTAACGDSFGPSIWDATPDTALIYSLSRAELVGKPSAYDFISLRRVEVESPAATGTWDVALVERDGVFMLSPAGEFPGMTTSRAGIAISAASSLEAVTEAPSDTAEFSGSAVSVQPGAIYIIRTRRESCSAFGVGVRYGKMQVVDVNDAAGTIRIAAVRNPLCNDRALIPPESN